MRIECPGCAAAYDVPGDQVRPGRSVRCVRCEAQWCPVEARPAEEIVPEATPVPIILPPVAGGPRHGPAFEAGGIRLRQPAAPRPGLSGSYALSESSSQPKELASLSWRAAWLASLIIVAGLLLAATYWRSAIMLDWPPSIRLYMALGMKAPG